MPYNGSGRYERNYNWQTDARGGVPIGADRMDTEMDGMVGAINDLLSGSKNVPGILPAGGDTGKFLRKSAAGDFVAEWADSLIPAGGSQGQVLRKKSNTDYDFEWVNPGDL